MSKGMVGGWRRRVLDFGGSCVPVGECYGVAGAIIPAELSL